ncbi:MAG: helix-turn-helix domain-containing protein [Anaerotignaceae bacterium]
MKNENIGFYTNFEQLPISLTPMDIAKILGLSKNNSYELCNSEGFPAIRIGKRILINKHRFIDWFTNVKSVELNDKKIIA